jgi:hypothetical protein
LYACSRNVGKEALPAFAGVQAAELEDGLRGAFGPLRARPVQPVSGNESDAAFNHSASDEEAFNDWAFERHPGIHSLDWCAPGAAARERLRRQWEQRAAGFFRRSEVSSLPPRGQLRGKGILCPAADELSWLVGSEIVIQLLDTTAKRLAPVTRNQSLQAFRKAGRRALREQHFDGVRLRVSP